MKMLLQTTVVIILCTVLASCGFHLRSNNNEPDAIRPRITDIVLNIQPDNPKLFFEITGILHDRYGVKAYPITNAAARDLNIITISEFTQTKQIIAYGNTGQAAEYNLQLSMHYNINNQLHHKHDTTTIKYNGYLSTNRNYQADPNQLLGEDVNTTALAQALLVELVDKLVNTIPQLS